MKRYALVLVVALVIGGVAGARYLLRDEGLSSSAPLTRTQDEATPTGRTVPVDVEPLPAGLAQDGTFTCAELRRDDGTFTAVARDATIRNASGKTLELGFQFTVIAGSRSEAVGRTFTMTPQQTAPSFLMASKSLPRSITRCKLRLYNAGKTVVPAVQQAAQRAGCTGPVVHADEGATHIPDGRKATYNTRPPTSGNHYGSPGRTGVHTTPIPNEVQVHNLEHGHIGLQYRGASRESIAVLVDAARQSGDFVFTAPYQDMEAVIALTAWRVSVVCAKDPASSDLLSLAGAFIDAYKAKAPETIPGTPA